MISSLKILTTEVTGRNVKQRDQSDKKGEIISNSGRTFEHLQTKNKAQYANS